ncbi:MAG TPA: DnaJ C-terminal domain-containing protein [Polyangia bacterium]|jgi:DnaJ-class molecular chaperone|nr:DnaJ C-terminal domain-containing protein [Polyangia bacterium]
MKDLYKTLGVAEDADPTTIKKAYRKLAKELHPDVTGSDKKKTERFKEINEAYAVLGDKEKRAEYDRLKHAPVRPDGMPEGFDAEAFARTFGGGVGGRGGRSGVQFSGDFVDLGDIFSSLFGEQARPRGGRGGGGGDGFAQARQRPSRGSDMLGSLEVTFAEAALGTRRTVGTGAGAEVEVQIPAGVETGGRLRVPGQGGPAPQKNGVPGDLFLDITVTPDRFLRRNGHDVELDLPVSVSEATLGAKVEVPTVEGRVTLSVPPGTSSGARLRLRGRGVKRPDGARGDQFCRVEIVVPRLGPNDGEIRKLFEEIGRRTAEVSVRSF